MAERIPCGACGRDLSGVGPRAVYAELGRAYRRCPGCASLQLWPLPTLDFNEAFEGTGAAEKHERSDSARHVYFQRRLDIVEPARTGAGPRLLEVGCGTGELMRLARERGWSVEGIELSASLAASARARNPGATIHEVDVLKWTDPPREAFAAAVALDLIEHVHSPAGFLRCLYAVMKPGGLLLLQTPNAGSLRARLGPRTWNMMIPRYHLTLFSAAGMRRALEDAGFAVVDLRTASGSGRERGLHRMVALIKEAALDAAGLGNALLVTARRP